MRSLFFLVFIFVTFSNIIVETEYGKVRGETHQDFYAFRGIPFASPPVGNLRWQPPVPPKSWEGILDATKTPPGCPQRCVLPPGSKIFLLTF